MRPPEKPRVYTAPATHRVHAHVPPPQRTAVRLLPREGTLRSVNFTRGRGRGHGRSGRSPGALPLRRYPSNEWTQDLEDWLRGLGFQAAVEADIYRHMSAISKSWNDRSRIVSGIISGLVGVEGLFAVFGGDDEPMWARILVTVLSVISLCLVTAVGVWRLDDVHAQSETTHTRLLTFKRSIELQMCIGWGERPPANHYSETLLSEYETVMLAAPQMYKSAVRAAERTFMTVYVSSCTHRLFRAMGEASGDSGDSGGSGDRGGSGDAPPWTDARACYEGCAEAPPVLRLSGAVSPLAPFPLGAPRPRDAGRCALGGDYGAEAAECATARVARRFTEQLRPAALQAASYADPLAAEARGFGASAGSRSPSPEPRSARVVTYSASTERTASPEHRSREVTYGSAHGYLSDSSNETDVRTLLSSIRPAAPRAGLGKKRRHALG